MEKWRTRVFPFFILLFFFLLDGMVANFFSGTLELSFGQIVPRLTLLCFVIFSFHLNGTYLFFLGLAFGFLFDSYFSGILGVYLASFSLITYMTTQLKTYFYPGWVSYLFIGVLMLVFNEFFVFALYRILDLVQMNFGQFWGNYIGATFLGNLLFLIILIPPLRKLANYVSDQGGS